jgi:hypothetical protein
MVRNLLDVFVKIREKENLPFERLSQAFPAAGKKWWGGGGVFLVGFVIDVVGSEK